jgi:hypothetical protein
MNADSAGACTGRHFEVANTLGTGFLEKVDEHPLP